MPESARGALAVLAASSATGSMGLAAGGTAGALLGVEPAGTDAAWACRSVCSFSAPPRQLC